MHFFFQREREKWKLFVIEGLSVPQEVVINQIVTWRLTHWKIIQSNTTKYGKAWNFEHFHGKEIQQKHTCNHSFHTHLLFLLLNEALRFLFLLIFGQAHNVSSSFVISNEIRDKTSLGLLQINSLILTIFRVCSYSRFQKFMLNQSLYTRD